MKSCAKNERQPRKIITSIIYTKNLKITPEYEEA
jgi:hypothetical protein